MCQGKLELLNIGSIEAEQRSWIRRTRVAIPLVVLISLIVVTIIPGGARDVGYLAGLLVRQR